MRVAVLGSSQSWYVADLQRAAHASGDHIVPLPFTEIRTCTFRGRTVVCVGETDLSDFDAVLVRSMPPGSLEQVVLRMDALLELESQGIHVINPPRSLEAAVDKFVATAKLARAGLNVPDTIVCQTADQAMDAFDALDRDVVLKPLFGSEGRGITRITDPEIGLRIFKSLVQTRCVFYLQRYIHHPGHDVRVFLLGETAIGMVRSNSDDWRTNIRRGGNASRLELTAAMRHAALQAADAVGTVVAGVDLIEDENGTQFVLEVNAVPGWKALAAVTGIDIAAQVIEFIRQRIDRPCINSERGSSKDSGRADERSANR